MDYKRYSIIGFLLLIGLVSCTNLSLEGPKPKEIELTTDAQSAVIVFQESAAAVTANISLVSGKPPFIARFCGGLECKAAKQMTDETASEVSFIRTYKREPNQDYCYSALTVTGATLASKCHLGKKATRSCIDYDVVESALFPNYENTLTCSSSSAVTSSVSNGQSSCLWSLHSASGDDANIEFDLSGCEFSTPPSGLVGSFSEITEEAALNLCGSDAGEIGVDWLTKKLIVTTILVPTESAVFTRDILLKIGELSINEGANSAQIRMSLTRSYNRQNTSAQPYHVLSAVLIVDKSVVLVGKTVDFIFGESGLGKSSCSN